MAEVMTTDDALAVCLRAVELAGGDAEATVKSTATALLRFAANEAIQHSTSRQVEVALRLRDHGRYGEAVASGCDDEALRHLVAQARQQSTLLPPAEVLPSAGPQQLAQVQAYHPGSSPDGFGADQRAAAAQALLAPAVAAGLSAAGICEVQEQVRAKATTNGMTGAWHGSEIALDVTAMDGDIAGRAYAWSRDPGRLDAGALGREAAEVALAAREPVALEPGAYRVVLSAEAVIELLGFVAGGFNARAVREGRSWLAGRVGEQIAAPVVRLSQQFDHPWVQTPPYDGDGVAIRPVAMIDGGVAANLLYDRRTAQEAGATATGYAQGGRNAFGAGPATLVMDGEDRDLDELLALCDDGVYVRRFWYANWVDPKACIATGMTRDGTFRVRDGKLAEPVRNLRFNQDLLAMLRGVVALGRPESAGSHVIAPVVVERFTFSSGTSF